MFVERNLVVKSLLAMLLLCSSLAGCEDTPPTTDATVGDVVDTARDQATPDTWMTVPTDVPPPMDVNDAMADTQDR